jgi:hypothetical protein
MELSTFLPYWNAGGNRHATGMVRSAVDWYNVLKEERLTK